MLFKSSFFTKKNLHYFYLILKSLFWFCLGAAIGFFFFVSFIYIYYQKTHANKVYAGVFVDGHDFSGKTKNEVKNYFAEKNRQIGKIPIQYISSVNTATISASQIEFGYDEDLLAEQAYGIGRTDNQLTNLSLIIQAYFNQINLTKAYKISTDNLDKLLAELKKEIDITPVNALFTFDQGRVSAFTLSSDGRTIDMDKLKDETYQKLKIIIREDKPALLTIHVPIKVVKPKITNENVNSLGITELIGQGVSQFQHSIENRVYNISLAAGRLNGLLIAPGEVFSFDNALGDVSTLTGYKQAYVIENGRTVLGDGGGVCQVSTTLFRAALAAGLPIKERHAHAYRVGYYEQDSGPGIDAAVYSPTVDLKFKNDTGHHILIQSFTDTANLTLVFNLYGSKDGRVVAIDKPVILSQSPAPEPLYQDDPTLPKGQLKQIDFAANGANVYFTRTVTKDDKVILDDKFTSNFRPWRAIFLRGTKE